MMRLKVEAFLWLQVDTGEQLMSLMLLKKQVGNAEHLMVGMLLKLQIDIAEHLLLSMQFCWLCKMFCKQLLRQEYISCLPVLLNLSLDKQPGYQRSPA